MITRLEPDILECEVKWALGTITMNKVSGSDGIPAELFQILKDDAVKVLHSIWQQIGKIQQWAQDWKRSVFILIPKKAMPKNVQTAAQLHSSHMLGFPVAQMVKHLPAIWDIWVQPLGWEEGNGNPLQYLCLENPMDGGAR